MLIGKPPGIHWLGRSGGEKTVTPFPGRQRPVGACFGMGLLSLASEAVFLGGLGLFPSETNLKSCIAALAQCLGSIFPRYWQALA